MAADHAFYGKFCIKLTTGVHGWALRSNGFKCLVCGKQQSGNLNRIVQHYARAEGKKDIWTGKQDCEGCNPNIPRGQRAVLTPAQAERLKLLDDAYAAAKLHI